MNKNVLIIKDCGEGFEKYYSDNMVNDLVDVDEAFKKIKNIVDMVLFVFVKKLRLSLLLNIWLEDWKYKINQYSTVIIFDAVARPILIKWIKKHNPNCRIILWWWNIPTSSKLFEYYKKKCENVCFDENFAIQNGIRFIQQFYIPYDLDGKIEIQNDLVYVGYDKNRYCLLSEIAKELKKSEISYDFNLINFNKIKSVDNLGIKIHNVPIDYKEMVKMINTSNAILELNLEGQNGLTLRALESVFYKKKLVTNNLNIKNFDFYNAYNIYILNQPNKYSLSEWLLKEYVNNSDVIKERYTYETWLKSILK